MPIEPTHVIRQCTLSAVLQYYQRGDFTSFSRACELAYGGLASSDPYFCANVLLAAQVCGLCDVDVSTGVTKWWVSHQGDVHIRSRKPKQIGTRPEWFEAHADAIVPLVTDARLTPLILGMHEPAACDASVAGLFMRELADLIPPFKDIEHQLCVKVPFSDGLAGPVEVFGIDTGRWERAAMQSLAGAQLLRVKKDYSGFTYFVQYADLALRFRITQPDWAFVIAFFFLPWRLKEVLQVDGSTVKVRRTVRLPALMYRTLFAGANVLRIGPSVMFEGMDPHSIAGVLRYFEQAGERA